MKKNRVLKLIPAYFASIIDITITIANQAPEYWKGDLSKANEGNPIGGTLMKMDVSGIFIISGLWLLIIGPLGYHLPNKLSSIFLLFVLVAHSFGAATWVSPRYGFWITMLLILVNSIIYILVNDYTEKQLKNL
jgi:hypothetical protein